MRLIYVKINRHSKTGLKQKYRRESKFKSMIPQNKKVHSDNLFTQLMNVCEKDNNGNLNLYMSAILNKDGLRDQLISMMFEFPAKYNLT